MTSSELLALSGVCQSNLRDGICSHDSLFRHSLYGGYGGAIYMDHNVLFFSHAALLTLSLCSSKRVHAEMLPPLCTLYGTVIAHATTANST